MAWAALVQKASQVEFPFHTGYFARWGGTVEPHSHHSRIFEKLCGAISSSNLRVRYLNIITMQRRILTTSDMPHNWRTVRQVLAFSQSNAWCHLISSCSCSEWQSLLTFYVILAGLTAPHPNAGCVLVDMEGHIRAETYQRAQVRPLTAASLQKAVGAKFASVIRNAHP